MLAPFECDLMQTFRLGYAEACAMDLQQRSPATVWRAQRAQRAQPDWAGHTLRCDGPQGGKRR